MIIYAIILHWIGIPGHGANPSLKRRPNPSVLHDLVFPIVKSDRFQFQISFSNILDFFMIFWNFSEFFCKIFKIGIDWYNRSILRFLIYKQSWILRNCFHIVPQNHIFYLNVFLELFLNLSKFDRVWCRSVSSTNSRIFSFRTELNF